MISRTDKLGLVASGFELGRIVHVDDAEIIICFELWQSLLCVLAITWLYHIWYDIIYHIWNLQWLCALQGTAYNMFSNSLTWFWDTCVSYPIHWPIYSFPEILNLTRSWICLPIPPSYTESWYMRYNLNSNLLDMMIWMTEIPHKQKGSISTNFRNSTKIHLHSSYRREKSHKEVAQSPELKAKHNETLFASTDSVFRKGSNVFCCIWEVSAQNYKAKLTRAQSSDYVSPGAVLKFWGLFHYNSNPLTDF